MERKSVMSDKQKLEVRISGRDYTLVSEEPPEYIHRVAFYVDQKMKEVESHNPRLSISMSAVLTALNIGDEFLKEQEKTGRLQEALKTIEEQLLLEKKQRDSLQQRLDELQKQHQALQIQYAKKETELEDALKSFELGLQNNNLTFDDLT